MISSWDQFESHMISINSTESFNLWAFVYTDIALCYPYAFNKVTEFAFALNSYNFVLMLLRVYIESVRQTVNLIY